MSDKTEIATIPNGLTEEDFVEQAQQNVGFKKDESIIPFTRIMQPLSPQLNTAPGAQPGMLLNISSGQLTDGKAGMNIVPIMHQWNYTEWVKREEGGGFIADWGDDETGWQAICEPSQRHAYKPITKDGHVIVKARHFAIFTLFDDGTFETSILPFTGTGLKIARSWSSMMQNSTKIPTSKGLMTPAWFYYVYKLNTEQVKNGQYTWYEPRVRPMLVDGKHVSIMDRDDGKIIWDAAIAFRDSMQAGTIRVASQAEEPLYGKGANETIDDEVPTF